MDESAGTVTPWPMRRLLLLALTLSSNVFPTAEALVALTAFFFLLTPEELGVAPSDALGVDVKLRDFLPFSVPVPVLWDK